MSPNGTFRLTTCRSEPVLRGACYGRIRHEGSPVTERPDVSLYRAPFAARR